MPFKRFYLGDAIIALCIVGAALLSALPRFLSAPSAPLFCDIQQGKTLLHHIRLAEGFRQTLHIPSPNGGSNTVIIDGTRISISDANCFDRVCVHSGTISKVGERLICLPHHLVISLTGSTKDTPVDAVVGAVGGSYAH